MKIKGIKTKLNHCKWSFRRILCLNSFLLIHVFLVLGLFSFTKVNLVNDTCLKTPSLQIRSIMYVFFPTRFTLFEIGVLLVIPLK